MGEKVTRLIVGTSYPFCSEDRLYRLRDNRFTGNGCSCKESPKRFKDDLALLHYVSLEIPANKAASDLGFGSTTGCEAHRCFIDRRCRIFCVRK